MTASSGAEGLQRPSAALWLLLLLLQVGQLPPLQQRYWRQQAEWQGSGQARLADDHAANKKYTTAFDAAEPAPCQAGLALCCAQQAALASSAVPLLPWLTQLLWCEPGCSSYDHRSIRRGYQVYTQVGAALCCCCCRCQALLAAAAASLLWWCHDGHPACPCWGLPIRTCGFG